MKKIITQIILGLILLPSSICAMQQTQKDDNGITEYLKWRKDPRIFDKSQEELSKFSPKKIHKTKFIQIITPKNYQDTPNQKIAEALFTDLQEIIRQSNNSTNTEKLFKLIQQKRPVIIKLLGKATITEIIETALASCEEL